VFKWWLPDGTGRLERLGGLEAAVRAVAGELDAAVSAAALGERFLRPWRVPEGQPAPTRPNVPAEPNSSPGKLEQSLPLPDDEPMHAPRPGSPKADPSSSGGGDPEGRNAGGAGEDPGRWLQSLVAAVVVCGVELIGGRDRLRTSPRL
jgi:hypothetical protein